VQNDNNYYFHLCLLELVDVDVGARPNERERRVFDAIFKYQQQLAQENKKTKQNKTNTNI
jgi:hypothetical protein